MRPGQAWESSYVPVKATTTRRRRGDFHDLLTSVEDHKPCRVASPEKTMVFVQKNRDWHGHHTLHQTVRAHAKRHRIKIVSHVYDNAKLHVTFDNRPEMARFRLTWIDDGWSCVPMTRR